MKRTQRACFRWGIVLAFVLLFIWGNSAMPKALSSEISRFFVRLFGGDAASPETASTVHYLVRKAAHFSEFFALALVGSCFLRAVPLPTAVREVVLFHGGLLVAVIDETVQSFNDRVSSVWDVWIDYTGFVAGALLFLLLYRLWKRRKSEKSAEIGQEQ